MISFVLVLEYPQYKYFVEKEDKMPILLVEKKSDLSGALNILHGNISVDLYRMS